MPRRGPQTPGEAQKRPRLRALERSETVQPGEDGGAGGSRTRNPLHAMQVRSHCATAPRFVWIIGEVRVPCQGSQDENAGETPALPARQVP